MKRAAIILSFATLLAGCAPTQFSVLKDDSYKLKQDSAACAIGNPEGVKADLRMEAARFCADRKEVPVEISSDGEYGIPAWRCAWAEIVFRCVPAGK